MVDEYITKLYYCSRPFNTATLEDGGIYICTNTKWIFLNIYMAKAEAPITKPIATQIWIDVAELS